MLISSAVELLIPRSGLTGWPRFLWRSHDREPALPGNGIRSFVIMKRLARGHVLTSHPPPQAHSPRIPGAFLAGHVIVWTYPPEKGW
jgi:hypothetical protein